MNNTHDQDLDNLVASRVNAIIPACIRRHRSFSPLMGTALASVVDNNGEINHKIKFL